MSRDAASKGTARRDFRLMSFNIRFGANLYGKPDLPNTIRTIAAAEPDIVALQEVDKHWAKRSGYADQALALSQALGMHAVYGANLDLEPPAPGLPRRQYGTAVLSKYPIVNSCNYPLSSFGYEQRGLLETEIDLNGYRLRVYCIHMGLTPEQRIAQAEEAMAVIGRNSGPILLAGDFNAVPDSPELRYMLSGGLSDSFAEVADNLTFPSDVPQGRIDYMLFSNRLELRQATVVKSTASDHRPIFGDFRFYGQAVGLN